MIEWIDLADKLPENEQEVLVTVRKGTDLGEYKTTDNEVKIAMFVNDLDVAGTWYPFFYLLDCHVTDLNKQFVTEIIAWAPLPEPYEIEEAQA